MSINFVRPKSVNGMRKHLSRDNPITYFRWLSVAVVVVDDINHDENATTIEII